MTLRKPSQGKIPFYVPDAGKPCQTWYKVVGDLDRGIPLIALHGGPGAAHEYILPFTDLHDNYCVPIVFYDQIGCGRSTALPEKAGDEDFWTIDLFIKELDTLIDYFGLRTRGFDILGQSWGGMLAGVYAGRNPPGLRKLILANAPASIPLMMKGVDRLIKAMPRDVQKTLEECHRDKDFESDKYKNACIVFYKRHLCRIDPFPDGLQTALNHLEEDSTVYSTMCVSTNVNLLFLLI
jgi:proline-specific peptidase